MAIKRAVKKILNKVKPQPPAPVPAAPSPVLGLSKDGCEVCGEPIAEGQTYVCKAHIRNK